MGRMIKQKYEWKCGNCSSSFPAFWGTCKNCGKAGTLEKFQLIPIKPKAKPSTIRGRWKRSEREIVRNAVAADGPEPAFSKVASSTGKVGHITNMRIDGISKSYTIEAKNRLIPKWLLDAWILIQQRAIDFNKYALLVMEPPNMPKKFPINGTQQKTSNMYIITQERHDDLIQKEQRLASLER